MLRRTPSLALRAGLIFMSIYAVIFVAVLTVALIAASAEPDVNRHDGARTALRIAAGEIRQDGASLTMPKDGDFARVAARNPGLWLIGEWGERSFSYGPVPAEARKLFQDYRDVLGSASFQVPNREPALRLAALRSYDGGPERLVLAAGGVNPASLTARDAFRDFGPEAALIVFAIIALLGFIAMLIALPLFSRAIRPITAEAKRVGPQELERRLDEDKAPREMLPLVRAFNATLDRLGSELRRRRQFIADVAHELRTPLAVVSLRVEALKDGSAKQDLRRGVGRLTHLVAQMLDLERLSLADRQHAPVDLVATARDVLADLAPMAMKHGYEVSLDAPEKPVTVSGDEHAIARAITNLIANAIAHGGGSGHIRVTVGTAATVDVADEGPGVPEPLLPQLFEPFSRGSQSSEGCGLGLHLTREIMRTHDGEVSLVPSASGATFRLKFVPANAGE